jgi:hypothetical protein
MVFEILPRIFPMFIFPRKKISTTTKSLGGMMGVAYGVGGVK